MYKLADVYWDDDGKLSDLKEEPLIDKIKNKTFDIDENSNISNIRDSIVIIKCPHCGKSHYTENYHTSTAMGWTPVVKDGVRYDEDPNIHTTHCTCLECGGEFSFDNRGDISKGRTGEEIKASRVSSDISLNEPQKINDEFKFIDTKTLINNDIWKNFMHMHNIIINDNVETLCIHYKGITYKFNLEKVLASLADIVEEVEIINK